jgi:hypothetical protein
VIELFPRCSNLGSYENTFSYGYLHLQSSVLVSAVALPTLINGLYHIPLSQGQGEEAYSRVETAVSLPYVFLRLLRQVAPKSSLEKGFDHMPSPHGQKWQ